MNLQSGEHIVISQALSPGRVSLTEVTLRHNKNKALSNNQMYLDRKAQHCFLTFPSADLYPWAEPACRTQGALKPD